MKIDQLKRQALRGSPSLARSFSAGMKANMERALSAQLELSLFKNTPEKLKRSRAAARADRAEAQAQIEGNFIGGVRSLEIAAEHEHRRRHLRLAEITIS
jgi:hypothetical protein